MKQVGPALLQVIHIKNKMQETVGVVSRASALVIPPFCKLSQPYAVGLGSTRRWTSAVLGARSRASTLLVARDAGRIPTVGDFSRQHRATRPKGCGASWERGWVLSFRHTLSNLGQQICNNFVRLRVDTPRSYGSCLVCLLRRRRLARVRAYLRVVHCKRQPPHSNFISRRDISTARRPRPSRARLGGGRVFRRLPSPEAFGSFTADTRANRPARALLSVSSASLSSQLVNRMGSGKQTDEVMGGVAPDAFPDGAPHSDPVTRRNTHPASRDAAPARHLSRTFHLTRPLPRGVSSPAQSTARPTRRIAARRNLSTTPPPPRRSFAAADPPRRARDHTSRPPPVSADASSDATTPSKPAPSRPTPPTTARRHPATICAPRRATRRRDAASATLASPPPRRRWVASCGSFGCLLRPRRTPTRKPRWRRRRRASWN